MVSKEPTAQTEHAEPISLRDRLLASNSPSIETLDAEQADRLARIVAALNTPEGHTKRRRDTRS